MRRVILVDANRTMRNGFSGFEFWAGVWAPTMPQRLAVARRVDLFKHAGRSWTRAKTRVESTPQPQACQIATSVGYLAGRFFLRGGATGDSSAFVHAVVNCLAFLAASRFTAAVA